MTDQTKDLLAMAEKSLADFLRHHEKSYYPSEVVFSRARQCLDAIRASATSAPVQTMQPLPDDELDLLCEKALFCKISKQQFARSIEAAHGITGTPDHTAQVIHMVGQPLTDEQIEAAVNNARKEWRAKCDEHNQWCDLGDDEKFLLVARAIESAVRTSQGDGWLDISKAPRDGTPVWLFTKYGQIEACWHQGRWVQRVTSCDHAPEATPTLEEEPTHFRYLPPPPNAQQGAAK